MSGALVASMLPFSLFQAVAENTDIVSNTNNNVVNSKIPTLADDAVLNWATKVGEGYDSNAIGTPIIVGDSLIFCSGTRLYKMDKYNGTVQAYSEMAGRSSYNIVPPTYADNKIFVGLANGTVQAFDAQTLKSLWIYKDQLSGQPNSPIVYSNGCVYTGFWNNEDAEANYVCISAKDEDAESDLEEKQSIWQYTHKGGFYWAGAYACSDYLLVGTDDGQNGSSSKTSCLLSLNPTNGKVIDKIEGLNGDIRSSVSYDNQTDRYYFTSKGGSFYSAAVNSNGTFKKNADSYDIKEIKLENGTDSTAMSTAAPVVHNGRAYIGVSGSSQFTEYSGHNITVIDLDSFKIAYRVPTKGYPQATGLLTTAYEDKDGYSYVYFVDNYTPGKVRFIKDKKGVTSVVDGVTESCNNGGKITEVKNCAQVLFTPVEAQANYALATPVADTDGTLYMKNDSAYMMSIGSKIDSLEVTAQPEKALYCTGDNFAPKGITVIAKFKNGTQRDVTKYITYPDYQLTEDYLDVTLTYDIQRYGDKLDKNNGNEIGIEAEPVEVNVDVTVLSKTDYDAVEGVVSAIDNIGTVTLESKTLIDTARNSYNSLDDSLKQYVSNYEALLNAEEELKRLTPTTPTAPSEPTVPTVPTAPSEPTVPTDPTEPSEPTVVPTTPTAPSEPTVPTTPTAPSEPTVPATPTAPSEPTAPTNASTSPTSATQATQATQGTTQNATSNNAAASSTQANDANQTGKVATGAAAPTAVLLAVMATALATAFVLRRAKPLNK